MSPFKSSLAKTAKQLLGLRNTADLGLRGAIKTKEPHPLGSTIYCQYRHDGRWWRRWFVSRWWRRWCRWYGNITFAVTINTAYPSQVGNAGAGSPAYPPW